MPSARATGSAWYRVADETTARVCRRRARAATSARAPGYTCGNPHCPKCRALRAARRLDQRRTQLLPTECFHVVFTVPAALRPLALRHRRRVFAVLLRAAAQTLLTSAAIPPG